MELRFLKGKSQTNQRMSFRTAFSLFRNLIGENTCNTVLEREILESWLIFRDHLLVKLVHPDEQGTSKSGRRPP